MMTCFGSCGYWRRRQMMLAQQQQARTLAQPYSTQYTTTPGMTRGPVQCHTTTLGVYPSYNYPGMPEGVPQTQGAFPAPPPYIEVSDCVRFLWFLYLQKILPPNTSSHFVWHSDLNYCNHPVRQNITIIVLSSSVDYTCYYTGMDNTCLYTSSGSLFVILSVGMSNVHVTSNVIITYHCSA